MAGLTSEIVGSSLRNRITSKSPGRFQVRAGLFSGRRASDDPHSPQRLVVVDAVVIAARLCGLLLSPHATSARRTTRPHDIRLRTTMRALVLFSAIVAITACSDSQQTTSPRSGAGGSAAGDVAPSGQGIKVPQAKPQGPVGFTTIQFIGGTWTDVAAGQGGGAAVQCPVGSVATGGGFEIAAIHGTAPSLQLSQQQTLGPNTGWVVSMDNSQPGAGAASIKAFVECAS
jgi:hypothetical protein